MVAVVAAVAVVPVVPVVAVIALVAAVAALVALDAAFGGASGKVLLLALGLQNGTAVNAYLPAFVGTDVALVAVGPHIKPRKCRRH